MGTSSTSRGGCMQRIQALKCPGLMPLVDVQFLELQRTVVLIDSCISVPTRRVNGIHTVVGTEIFLLEETHRAAGLTTRD